MANGGLEQRVASVEAQMQELRDIVLQLAQSQARTQQQLEQTIATVEQTIATVEQTIAIVNETSTIARSNARSIAAWEALIQQNKDEAEEELSRQAVWIRDLQEANRENVLQHMEFRQNHTDSMRRFDENQRRFDEIQAAINRILDRLGG